MSTAPNDDAVGRAWSWALTKAGMMKVRGEDVAVDGVIAVMRRWLVLIYPRSSGNCAGCIGRG